MHRYLDYHLYEIMTLHTHTIGLNKNNKTSTWLSIAKYSKFICIILPVLVSTDKFQSMINIQRNSSNIKLLPHNYNLQKNYIAD